MRVPGSVIERLTDLPEDVAVPSALLRLALQAGVPCYPVDDVALTNWSLAMPEQGQDMDRRSLSWARRRAAPGSFWAPLSAGVERAILPLLPRFFGDPVHARTLTGVTSILLLLAAFSTIQNWIIAGLAAATGAAIGIVMSGTVARAMSYKAFRLHTRSVAQNYLGHALEIVLALLVFLGLLAETGPTNAIFTTIVLFGLGFLGRASRDTRLRRFCSDIILFAGLLTLGAVASILPLVVQALSLVLLGSLIWICKGRLTTD